jgi:hypothetical protein
VRIAHRHDDSHQPGSARAARAATDWPADPGGSAV